MTNDPHSADGKGWKLPLGISSLVLVVSLPTLLTAAFIAWFAYDTWSNAPEAAASQQRIERSRSEIRVRPGDFVIESSTVSKSHHGYAGSYYNSSASYAALRAYYDLELASHGWVLCGERPVREWGRDTGGTKVMYRNGIDSLSFTHSGEPASDGWTYAISVTWGRSQSCDD